MCRVDAQSSSVVWSTTTTVEGMPFADSWRVHVRWAISPVEDEAVLIEIGYAIEVLKPFMMESLLRSNAMIRVRDRQIHLLRVFRTVLKAEIEARNRKHPMVEAVRLQFTTQRIECDAGSGSILNICFETTRRGNLSLWICGRN